MLALSSPKNAVTVSIIAVVHKPRRYKTGARLHSQKDFERRQELESG
jgi:hypothetical protein